MHFSVFFANIKFYVPKTATTQQINDKRALMADQRTTASSSNCRCPIKSNFIMVRPPKTDTTSRNSRATAIKRRYTFLFASILRPFRIQIKIN